MIVLVLALLIVEALVPHYRKHVGEMSFSLVRMQDAMRSAQIDRGKLGLVVTHPSRAFCVLRWTEISKHLPNLAYDIINSSDPRSVVNASQFV